MLCFDIFVVLILGVMWYLLMSSISLLVYGTRISSRLGFMLCSYNVLAFFVV